MVETATTGLHVVMVQFDDHPFVLAKMVSPRCNIFRRANPTQHRHDDTHTESSSCSVPSRRGKMDIGDCFFFLVMSLHIPSIMTTYMRVTSRLFSLHARSIMPVAGFRTTQETSSVCSAAVNSAAGDENAICTPA